MKAELCVAALLMGVGGCAATPQPNSLQAIRLAAQDDAFNGCVRELVWKHRHVPTRHLWQTCEAYARHVGR
jgi:hypothetical protein